MKLPAAVKGGGRSGRHFGRLAVEVRCQVIQVHHWVGAYRAVELGELELDASGLDLFKKVSIRSDVREVALTHICQAGAGGGELPSQLFKCAAHAALSPYPSCGGSNFRRINSASPSLVLPMAVAQMRPCRSATTAP